MKSRTDYIDSKFLTQLKNFQERRKITKIIIILFALLLLIPIALVQGVYPIPYFEVFRTIFVHLNPFQSTENLNTIYSVIVWDIRMPRVLLAAAVGIALASAGGVYQGCFRNPLVEPYILGVESGAAFGAALAIVLPTFLFSLQLSAFLFGISAVLLSYSLSRVRGETPVIMLILSGIVIGSLFMAGVSALKYLAVEAALREIVFWLMGGFYYSTWKDVILILPIVFLGFLIIWGLSWKLNVLSMGDDEAKALGIRPELYKGIFITIATLITAICVSAVGIIAWVGLMMPHAARLILGPDHRFMLPTAAMIGAIYMIICDTLARTLTTAEIPVGILTSIIGAPYLIYLIRSRGKIVFG
ncbi:MAG: Cobalamin import system permease protein BtuC [Candidatus Methanofastidiosum methylothiophilum]|uniref:Cobalamin import system permease protein BtuC n=1 Tax=Candidatus Methanofastidiosum methylothiophilum TaxID=1705564 RepID=A0A150INP7_9EURY|nr:MAG: Cobalamin import system permease protein BtuC [Candidatus Methanofastidiosum methylthiophilus]